MRTVLTVILTFLCANLVTGGHLHSSPPAEVHDFTWAAQHAIPAAVLIKVKLPAKTREASHLFGSQNGLRQGKGQGSFDLFGHDDFWEQFFGLPRLQEEPQALPQQFGQGSGFLISADGYLITNSHVVRDMESITVVLQDGREFPGKLIGHDVSTDVAVVKIEAANLPYLSFGNSDELQVGQWVGAVGNPFGLQASFTVGVVSGKRRSDLDIAQNEDFIQTDAAINKGNSGGPLLNMKGEVVGLNTAIASITGGSMGIGFAIPSNMVHYVMEQLIAGGSVARGYIGVNLQKIDQDLAHALGLEKIEGALVADIMKQSPAEVAGLQQGDIILAYDQHAVDNLSAFRNKVALTKPGTKMVLSVRRGNEVRDLTVETASHPDNVAPAEVKTPQLGIEVEELSQAIAQNLGYYDEKGVVISKVYPNTPAAMIGLKKGSLILSVNKKKVTNIEEYQNALKELPSGQVLLLLIKQGPITRYVTLRVS